MADGTDKTDFKSGEEIKFQVRESMAALMCGAGAIGFACYIFAMWLLHPSGKGGGVLLFLPLFGMAAGGALCLVLYFNKRLVVEEMNIHYVNCFGKIKQFTLDEIGFCKAGAGSSRNQFILYDLRGEKLCKLGIDMRGLPELHQYLIDNRVRVEWSGNRGDSEALRWIEAVQKETAVCAEEIRKCSEAFYALVEPVFREWEKKNKRFDVYWEIGFAQYASSDTEQKCPPSEYTSSFAEPSEVIPPGYECMLEAYLKRGSVYVVDRHGRAVSIILPYLVRSRSYQIGEGTRIRKTDEESMKEWLEARLFSLARELPRHKYRTEQLTIKHPLKKNAGI